MITDYSVNRIEIVIKVLIEFAAAIRAFAAKLLQRRLEPSLLDSQRTKIRAGGTYSYNDGVRCETDRRSAKGDVSRVLFKLGTCNNCTAVLLRFVSKISSSRAIFFKGFPISIGNSSISVLSSGVTFVCLIHVNHQVLLSFV